MVESARNTEARFLVLLRRALEGWQQKVDLDFSEHAAQAELDALEGDPVYEQFGLATPGYVLVRLMGRMSISIGRRLGELYDNLPKFVAAARFGLQPSNVAARIAGLNLDVQIPFALLTDEDEKAARLAVLRFLAQRLPSSSAGLGIEIRYNFNPNDSARLRKDVSMAEGLIAAGLHPIYLVYSGISPRQEAIERLRRAGWSFIIGQPASDFTRELLGLDLATLMSSDAVQTEVTSAMDELMESIMTSPAMLRAVDRHGRA